METFDGQVVVLLGTKKYTFTKLLNGTDEQGNVDDCFFNVEVKAGSATPNFAGLTYARFVDLQMYNLNIRVNQDESVTVSQMFVINNTMFILVISIG